MTGLPPVRGAHDSHVDATLAAFEREVALRGVEVSNRFPYPLDRTDFDGRFNYVLGSFKTHAHVQVRFPGLPVEHIRAEGVPLAVEGRPHQWDAAVEAVAALLSHSGGGRFPGTLDAIRVP